MVFDVAQVVAFFEDNDQMVLSHRTRLSLQYEVIVRPDDLVDFTADDSWKQIIHNCKHPARIPDPNNEGQTISQEAFQFPARSLMCIKVCTVAVE